MYGLSRKNLNSISATAIHSPEMKRHNNDNKIVGIGSNLTETEERFKNLILNLIC